jgi:hypothetical protein
MGKKSIEQIVVHEKFSSGGPGYRMERYLTLNFNYVLSLSLFVSLLSLSLSLSSPVFFLYVD